MAKKLDQIWGKGKPLLIPLYLLGLSACVTKLDSVKGDVDQVLVQNPNGLEFLVKACDANACEIDTKFDLSNLNSYNFDLFSKHIKGAWKIVSKSPIDLNTFDNKAGISLLESFIVNGKADEVWEMVSKSPIDLNTFDNKVGISLLKSFIVNGKEKEVWEMVSKSPINLNTFDNKVGIYLLLSFMVKEKEVLKMISKTPINLSNLSYSGSDLLQGFIANGNGKEVWEMISKTPIDLNNFSYSGFYLLRDLIEKNGKADEVWEIIPKTPIDLSNLSETGGDLLRLFINKKDNELKTLLSKSSVNGKFSKGAHKIFYYITAIGDFDFWKDLPLCLQWEKSLVGL